MVDPLRSRYNLKHLCWKKSLN